VHADLHLDAPADAVLALLADPTQVALLSPDVRSARSTAAGAAVSATGGGAAGARSGAGPATLATMPAYRRAWRRQ
jgi:hypothetical protein